MPKILFRIVTVGIERHKMNAEPNAELIRFARLHRYHIAEGFADPNPGGELELAVEEAIDDLSAEERDILDADAEKLSESAGIPLHEAQSALLNWIFKKHNDEWRAQENN
jgi:hypothetical protein